MSVYLGPIYWLLCFSYAYSVLLEIDDILNPIIFGLTYIIATYFYIIIALKDDYKMSLWQWICTFGAVNMFLNTCSKAKKNNF